MAGQLITIPNFDFSGFYYPQLLEALLAYKRINSPELTDESEKEASIQLIRAFALTGHLNNVLIDLIANESTLPTAQLAETVRNMLRLIDYELAPALPSQVDLLYKLSKVFAAPFSLIPTAARAATAAATGDVPIIFFEALPGITIARTDQLGVVFKYDNTAATYTDNTTAANAGTNWDGSTIQGDSTGDVLYFGHSNVMFSVLNIAFVSGPSNVTLGVWEYFDGSNSTTRPDSISVSGDQITFNLNGLLGSQNRAGALIRVVLNASGAFRDIFSDWDGTNNSITTVDLMGQSTPSAVASDYSVGSNWQELENVIDGTAAMTQSGEVSFLLPQNLNQNWTQTTVNQFTGFFVRFRAVNAGPVSSTVLARIRIDTGAQFVIISATQGQSVTAETLGSSNGDPNQQFDCQQNGFILGSQQVRVDDVTWTLVDNFLNSAGQDKVYRIILGENDKATIIFGDGTNSKIPDIGQGNCVIDYRFGASDNGNVGANTVTVDKQGLSFVQSITNPRSASGWVASQASDPVALEQAKVAGPASIRTRQVALSTEDLVDLTTAFVNSTGVQPFSRAKAIEEGFGPKTVEVVTVVHGGSTPSTAQLAELKTYFNGDKNATPPLKKHFIANQEAVPTAFTAHPIDVNAIVHAPSDLTAEQIANALAAVLQPEARREDGVTYTWDFGGQVPYSRISHEIFRVDARITNVDLGAATDTVVQLSGRELPVPGTFAIQIVSTSN